MSADGREGEALAPGRQGRAHLYAAVLAAAALVFLALPLVGLLSRVTGAEIWRQLAAPGVATALRVSLEVSLMAVLLSAIFGLPLAYALARLSFPGKSAARGLVLLPMVLPPVVGGVGLLAALGRRGAVGAALEEWFGVHLPFTTAGAVVAVTFVAAPFLVLTVEGALRGLDPRFERAAATLGASQGRILGTIVLPAIRPSLLAGLALCWARALGEFGATITFAGNLPGHTQTLPLAVYEALYSGPEGAVALSLILLAIALVILFVLRGRLIRV